MNNLEDECLWSYVSRIKDNITFKHVTQKDPLYRCIECSGEKGSCGKYSSYKNNTAFKQNASQVNDG